MADEAELAFVATMRDEATSVAKQARRTLDSVGGRTAPIEVPLAVRDGITSSLRSVSSSLDSVSRKASDLGGNLTRSLTVPILGAGVAVGKVSIDFSRSMGDVASLLPGNTERVNELREAVLRIGPDSGSSLGETARGLYQTLSAFGDTADTALILEQNAKAARAGAASVSDAIALTSAVTKSYGDTSAKAVGKASDLALLTVRLGQTTFPELAGSIGAVTPLTKALGAEQEELFATMATFTGVTGGASEVSTQLRGALQGLMAPTDAAAKAIKKAGFESGEALVEQEGLAGAITFLVDAADKSGKPLQDYIGSIEGQTIALGLAGAQGDSYRKNLEQMAGAAGATDAAFKSSTTGVGEQAFAWDKAKVEAESLLVSLGDGLAPAVLDLIEASKPVAGQVKEWADAFADADPETQQMIASAVALTAAVGPLLVVVGKLGTGVAGTIKGISAVTGVIGTASTKARTLTTDLKAAETRQAALGRASRVAAGAAGIGALIASTQTESDELAGLLEVGGLIATGFAVGGPIGGAFAAATALVMELTGETETAGGATSDLADDQYELRDALNQTTGAITRQAKEQVSLKFQQDGVFESAKVLGIAQRDLVASALGNAAAQKRVAAGLKGAEQGLRALVKEGKLTDGEFRRVTAAMDQVRGHTLSARQEFNRTGRQLREASAAADSWRKALKGLPKKAQTDVKALGIDPAMKDLRKLSRQYDLTPKRVETVLRAMNTEITNKQIRAVQETLKDTGKIRGDLSGFLRGLEEGTGRAKGEAERGGRQVREGIEKPIAETEAPLEGVRASINAQIPGLSGTSRTGGSGIGVALKQGVLAGVDGLGVLLSAQISAAVGAGIQAGKNRAGIKSPSRVMRDEVGRMIGEGAILGVRDTIPDARKAGEDFVASILGVSLRDLDRGSQQIEATLGKLEKAIGKRIDARIQDADRARKRTAEVLRDLRQETRALRENGAEYDRLSRRIKAARAAGREFGETLRSYASVASFSPVNDAPVTAGFLVNDLEQRLAAIRAFAKNLEELRDRGVSDQVIRDLQSQGVEAGGASAAALAAATDAQLDEINALTGQIANASEEAGKDSVRGLVRGLLGDLAGVEAAGRRLARKLREAIRKELGIRSPSRRLREDGVDSVRGLTRGILDETGAAEAAARVMADRVALAAVPSLGDLSRLADATSRIRPASVRSSEVLVIRHEVTSPDGSLDDLTADQVATLIARDPRASRALEAALRRHRAREASTTIRPSD